ncbi:hypothetical protein B0T18DRAFT_417786 [Schizothecium vesticola]|uniref:Secreted protein n=1 Tax=Schizothecium vesticola TaxID=314040 RepID=A0AA40JYX8_9PEZI|nr:hypothetical protein B0T18DRAFT_417786 [Schizothecium vesticola]
MRPISGLFLAFLSLLSLFHPAQGSTFLYPPSLPNRNHHLSLTRPQTPIQAPGAAARFPMGPIRLLGARLPRRARGGVAG